ncbi:MazG nucleotide pyrophosphohydrolase domain-containing protein [Brachybacterium sp. YJGR34]|uniref:MazG nucleotide pyrophosphohydrolase domain-containing protein n=1 Tax=Brachybacterium sp. YJGR34 TaxID=2059911 RepID=UPI0018E655E1|nr:MazG nucleotide pyrophosphohydrolase domain-containing protein [Brachybacterium sp. YJGR34]
MSIPDMTARARQVRSLFADVDVSRSRRPWSTEEVMLGFVGDVGDLAKLVLGKAEVRPRADLEDALAHELADCLWSLLVLADEYEIDLNAAYHQLMDDLDEDLRRHLPDASVTGASGDPQ